MGVDDGHDTAHLVLVPLDGAGEFFRVEDLEPGCLAEVRPCQEVLAMHELEDAGAVNNQS